MFLKRFILQKTTFLSKGPHRTKTMFLAPAPFSKRISCTNKNMTVRAYLRIDSNKANVFLVYVNNVKLDMAMAT